MKLLTLSLATGLLLGLSSPVIYADTLLIERVKIEQSQNLPKRGTSMSKVEATYGTPVQKIPAVGGGSVHTPPITRWRYSNYTVYFANSYVVDSVMNKVNAEEVGPAPAQK